MNAFQEAMKYRKAGDPERALRIARNVLHTNPDDLWMRRAAGWAIYDIIKRLLDKGKSRDVWPWMQEIIALALPSEEDIFYTQWAWTLLRLFRMANDDPSCTPARLDQWASAASALSWQRPSEAYSIWIQAIIAYKGHWPGRKQALSVANLTFLRQEDYLPRRNKQGRAYLSLAESAYGALVKTWLEILTNRTDPQADVFTEKELGELLERLDVVAATQPAFKLIPYYRARLIRATRGDAEATRVYLPFLVRNTDKFWAWELMGDLLIADNNRAIACYMRAIRCPGPETYLVNTHWKLARALQASGHEQAACWHMQESLRIRLDNGWSVPATLQQALDRIPPAHRNTQAPDEGLYKAWAHEADALIDSAAPKITVLISHVNEAKKVLHLVLPEDRSGYAPMPSTPGEWQKDTLLRCCVEDRGKGRYHLQTIEKQAFTEVPGLTTYIIADLHRKPGQAFGWVSDAYIPPALLEQTQIPAGTRIKAECVRSYEPRKQRWGWKAIRLEQE